MMTTDTAVRCVEEHADMPRRKLVIMSTTEIDRASIVAQLLEHRLTQAQAARQLGVTPRQVRRPLVRYGADSPAGLVPKKRGGVGNRSKPDALKARVLEIVREDYADFGPTLDAEKFVGRRAITVLPETARRWMRR